MPGMGRRSVDDPDGDELELLEEPALPGATLPLMLLPVRCGPPPMTATISEVNLNGARSNRTPPGAISKQNPKSILLLVVSSTRGTNAIHRDIQPHSANSRIILTTRPSADSLLQVSIQSRYM